MNKIKKVARSSTNFVMNHKTAIAVGVTALVLTTINRSAIRDYDEFLDTKNLKDEFYAHLAA